MPTITTDQIRAELRAMEILGLTVPKEAYDKIEEQHIEELARAGFQPHQIADLLVANAIIRKISNYEDFDSRR